MRTLHTKLRQAKGAKSQRAKPRKGRGQHFNVAPSATGTMRKRHTHQAFIAALISDGHEEQNKPTHSQLCTHQRQGQLFTDQRQAHRVKGQRGGPTKQPADYSNPTSTLPPSFPLVRRCSPALPGSATKLRLPLRLTRVFRLLSHTCPNNSGHRRRSTASPELYRPAQQHPTSREKRCHRRPDITGGDRRSHLRAASVYGHNSIDVVVTYRPTSSEKMTQSTTSTIFSNV